jgi:hypothetical protein
MLATPADFDEQRAYCKMHIDLRHGGAKEGFSYGGKVGDWRLCLISSYCGRVRACVGGWWLVLVLVFLAMYPSRKWDRGDKSTQ